MLAGMKRDFTKMNNSCMEKITKLDEKVESLSSELKQPRLASNANLLRPDLRDFEASVIVYKMRQCNICS